MKNSFKVKADTADRFLKNNFKPFVFAAVEDKDGAVIVQGKPLDLLFCLHKICMSLREEFVKNAPEELVDEMLSTVIMTEGQIKDQIAMYEKKQKADHIPEWFRDLMGWGKDDDDDDDEEDEDDDAEEESSDDHIATPEEVADFIKNCSPEELEKYATVGKAIEDMQNALGSVGLKFSGRINIDHADRSDDRG